MPAPPQELRDLLLANEPLARDAAWARFVDRFSPLLLHTARRRAPEHDRAMDAYAHVLDRLRDDDFRRLRQYAEDPRAQFTTWLTLVAQRLCVDHLRQSYGRFRAERPLDATGQDARRRLADLIAEEITAAKPVEDPSEAADANLRRNDLLAALQSCLARLSPAQRLLLAMRYEEELPAREISQLLSYATPFHVYRAINTALVALRLCLERRGVNDPEP